MKRFARLPALAGAIVVTAVVASLAPNPASRANAQVVGDGFQSHSHYNPYGQGRYGYGQQRYGTRGTFGRNAYGYSGYGVTPYGYGSNSGYRYGNSTRYRSGSLFNSGRNPYIRSYGGTGYYQPYSGYYQPYNGGVYFGFGGY